MKDNWGKVKICIAPSTRKIFLQAGTHCSIFGNRKSKVRLDLITTDCSLSDPIEKYFGYDDVF